MSINIKKVLHILLLPCKIDQGNTVKISSCPRSRKLYLGFWHCKTTVPPKAEWEGKSKRNKPEDLSFLLHYS